MAAEPILEIDHLIKRVGQGENEITILQGAGLVVESEETIALVGESGSGKSTLLGIIAGLDDATSG
ncbi:MAG: ATP-binding cassette domain-containing protein, partial [Morganella morganii]|nr:ATP-binding cassette domain-containing protein [Morganella morganii]